MPKRVIVVGTSKFSDVSSSAIAPEVARLFSSITATLLSRYAVAGGHGRPAEVDERGLAGAGDQGDE